MLPQTKTWITSPRAERWTHLRPDPHYFTSQNEVVNVPRHCKLPGRCKLGRTRRLVGLRLGSRRRWQLGVLVIRAGKAALQATNCFAKILANGRQAGRPK